MFDWEQFLDNHGIDYVTTGHNARRGNIGIACPWCGNDPSHHLGISTNGRGYHCWRNEAHSGKAPHRLVMALLGCSYAEAVMLVGEGGTFATTDGALLSDVTTMLGAKESAPRVIAGKLNFLPEMHPLEDRGLAGRLAFPYLEGRGYSTKGVEWIAKRFRLHFASFGPFGYRVVVPIYQDGDLVNWTGRTVARSDELRYKSLSTDPARADKQGGVVALRNIKDCLLDYDRLLEGGLTLVVCEGPFDAIRVTYLGEAAGIRGTCLFSKSPLPAQLDRLSTLVERYDESYSLFDGDAFDTVMGLPDYLEIKALTLPPDKDPAQLTRREFDVIFPS